MLVSYNSYTKKYAVEFGIGYGIAFDGAVTWRFGNDYARNVTIFDVDNSSWKLNGSFDLPWKKFRINLVKQRQTFVWVYIKLVIIVICLLMENKYLGLKPIMEMSTF